MKDSIKLSKHGELRDLPTMPGCSISSLRMRLWRSHCLMKNVYSGHFQSFGKCPSDLLITTIVLKSRSNICFILSTRMTFFFCSSIVTVEISILAQSLGKW